MAGGNRVYPYEYVPYGGCACFGYFFSPVWVTEWGVLRG